MAMALRFGLALIKKRLVAASRNHEYLGLIPDVSCKRKLLKANEQKYKSNHIQKSLMKAANAMSVRRRDMFEPNGINHRLKSWKAWSPKGLLASAFIFQHLPNNLFTTMFGASVSTARSAVVVAADMLVKLTKSALEGKFHSTSSAAQQPDCGVQVCIEKRAWDETRHTIKVPPSSANPVFQRLIKLEIV